MITAVAYVIVGLFAASLLIPALQAFWWLKTGEWHEMSVLWLLGQTDAPNVVNWVIWPQSWLGLHTLLGKTPLALACFIVACLSFWLVVAYAEGRK
jgi:hypothetical protein